MTPEHKAALAEGRAESRVVKAYLEALEENRPKRGRRRTKEGIERRLVQISSEIDTAPPLQRVALIQERMDLTAELEAPRSVADIEPLKAAFIEVAKSYSARKQLSYGAWRELGVAADVLKAAGISRSS